MEILEKPRKAPAWKCKNAEGKVVSAKDFSGEWYVIYFYPKDMTPGCTTEAQEFQASLKKFAKLNCNIIGVSKDSCERHIKFAEKEGLEFVLLSDEEGSLCEAFDVWKEKLNYGKKYMGIERSTFLVNDKGLVVSEERKVRVAGHVERVLDALKLCQKSA